MRNVYLCLLFVVALLPIQALFAQQSPYGAYGCGWYESKTNPQYSNSCTDPNGYLNSVCANGSSIDRAGATCGGSCPPGQACYNAAGQCLCVTHKALDAAISILNPGQSVGGPNQPFCGNIARTGIQCGGVCPKGWFCVNSRSGYGSPCICISDSFLGAQMEGEEPLPDWFLNSLP
jgi:hypothetical protein